MASFSRPPESRKSHSNTPKLKLPSLVNDASSPSSNHFIFEGKEGSRIPIRDK